jgi:DNA (cytosine-5)-methyltransferase 1
MAKKEKQPSKWISIGQAAKFVGVSRDTLRRWEKKGKLKPFRSPTNRRYYTKNQLQQLMEKRGSSKVQKRASLALSKKNSLFIPSLVSLLITIIVFLLIYLFILS